MDRCLYNSNFDEFIKTENRAILGELCENYHGEAFTTTREAWSAEISIMKSVLYSFSSVYAFKSNNSIYMVGDTKIKDEEGQGEKLFGSSYKLVKSIGALKTIILSENTKPLML